MVEQYAASKRPDLSGFDECGSMDFVHDELFNGRRIRALTVVDRWSRKSLAITVGAKLRGDDVVATMDHPLIVSFHGTFRVECLNAHWLLSVEDACGNIEAWRQEYNRIRPHRFLGDLTPEEFREAHQEAREIQV